MAPRSRVGRRGGGNNRCAEHYLTPVSRHYSPSSSDDDMTEPSSLDTSVNVMMIDNCGVGSSSGLKELIPGEFWFTKSDVVRGVTKSIQKNYNYPWRNWTETPKETKDLWFKEFKRLFTWRPELEWEVRASYYEKAGQRLKDIVHCASKKRPEDRPDWMSARVHKDLLKRKEEKGFKKRSEQAKKNKRSGSDKLVHPGHCQGSISTAEVAERLAKETKGVPTAADVFLRTHSREVEGQGRVLVDDKSKKIMENYHVKIAEYKQRGIKIDPNEVFWEIVGGRRKGHVQGLGSGADMFYERSSGRTSKSTVLYTPSLLSQLSSQTEEAKRLAEENSEAYHQQMELHDKQTAEFERQKVELDRQRADLERERIQLERERLQMERDKMEEKKHFNQYLLEMQTMQKQMNQFFLLFVSKTLQCEPNSQSQASQPPPLALYEAGESEKSTRCLTSAPNQTRKNKRRCRE